MTNLIKQRFLYGTNSDPPSLWASMGYIYGKCARQLHYTNQFGYTGFTESEMKMMESGKDIHDIVEHWMINTYPDMSFEDEVKRSMNILIDDSPFVIGAKPDLIANWHPNLRTEYEKLLIEIKYLYGRKAYYQTLIEKLVFPEHKVMCFQYGNLRKPQFANNILIPIKANLDMAKVYAGRIITSLYHMPPRFPGAYYGHNTCSHCIHRELCYSDKLDSDVIRDLDSWDTFKRQSQPYITAIQNLS